ncbi:G-type lectin S-receptor serine/threonine-protein kinase [Salix suchowensis]|nr:G-type lectin S-receptor serine/threonine-protein kinase [Salix suchowensis]
MHAPTIHHLSMVKRILRYLKGTIGLLYLHEECSSQIIHFCCRKNFEINAREEHQTVLADWACDCFKEGKLNLLVEEDEEAMEDMKRVERFVMVAIWCIQEDPSLRPAMKKVVQMLEGGVQVSVPPDPSSFISSI